jgi:hypothetical protein
MTVTVPALLATHLRPPVQPHDEVDQQLVRVLGHDQATLARLRQATRFVVTFPHASPNVFFPRALTAWSARELQRQDADVFHLRIVLTHTNFSDLRWRPYAWWVIDGLGRLCRMPIFSRNKKRKHVVVASQPPLDCTDYSALTGHDREAGQLAERTRDLSGSFMALTASVERACGFVAAGRTSYVALNDLLVALLRAADGMPVRTAEWLHRLVAGSSGRRVLGSDGTLQLAGADEVPFVLGNAENLALLALLPDVTVIGGAKMQTYWPQIVDLARCGRERQGAALTTPRLRLRDEAAAERLWPPTPSLMNELAAAGIGYSQGMALALHGRLVE